MTDQLGFDFSLERGRDSSPEAVIIAANPDRYAPDFAAWLVDNWHVWREFRRQAELIRARGYTHYSARTIIHFLRHHSALAEVSNAGWKLNDHWSADLGRLYMDVTGLHDFFETRVQRDSSKRAA